MKVGYVYVIEFSNGLVKIGSSAYPKARVRACISKMKHDHNVSMVRFWISEKTEECIAIELKSHSMFIDKRIFSEMFKIDFSHAITTIGDLVTNFYEDKVSRFWPS